MNPVETNLVGRRNGTGSSRGPAEDELSDFELGMGHFRNIIDMNTLRTPNESDAETLRVNKVDFDIFMNAFDHKTFNYDVLFNKRCLLVRRGQTFQANVTFNRPYDRVKDDLRIVFQFGNNGHPGKGTHVEFLLSDEDKVSKWGGWLKSSTANSVSLGLSTSFDAPVGQWKMNIDVVKKTEGGDVNVFRYKHTDPIYILFNPWCKDDGVYLHDDDLCDEYVLNDTGLIYRGNYKNISYSEWAFGQFEGDVLDCVLYLLDKNMIDRYRGDPVLVTRKISSVINEADNLGVLVGNWSGDYEGGTRPTKWTGSADIFKQYYQTKKPVKYGQCWVFSGLVTTACRALGIPTRSVTNFASAHDTNLSTTIDKYYNSDYEEIEFMNNDSVWNFHVWNDAWMARPLLPPGYGGWQAIDATPQEMSDGMYACGPMSVQAIRRGDLSHAYDGSFIFAEVNADRIFWIVHDDGSREPARVFRDSVGKFISTKKPFVDEREDLTNVYKFEEGTEEERAAVHRAKRYATDVDPESTPTDNVSQQESTDNQCVRRSSNKKRQNYTVTQTKSGINYKEPTFIQSEQQRQGNTEPRCYTCKQRKDIKEACMAVRRMIKEMDSESNANEKHFKSDKQSGLYISKSKSKSESVCAVDTIAKTMCSVPPRQPVRVTSHLRHNSRRQNSHVKVTCKLSTEHQTKHVMNPSNKSQIIDVDSMSDQTSGPLIKQTISVKTKRKKHPKKNILNTNNEAQEMQSVYFSQRKVDDVPTVKSELRESIRSPLEHGHMYSPSPQTCCNHLKSPNDVEFAIDINSGDDTFLGDDAVVRLKIKNTSNENRTINGTMSMSSMYYTGVHCKHIKKEKLKNKEIKANEEIVLELKVTYDEYNSKLTDHAFCNINTMYKVTETKQLFTEMTELRLRKPHLTIKGPSTAKKGEKITLEASFKNPLSVPLTNCDIGFEGPGLQSRRVITQRNVAANATFVTNVDIIPAKKGKRELIVMFDCDQIYAVTGKHKVEVSEE